MQQLKQILQKHQTEFHQVVDFDPRKDKLYRFDFSAGNTTLSRDDIADTEKFSSYIDSTLQQAGAKYGIGGYDEDRVLYSRSGLFEGTEPRTVHLGIDIWGTAGTKVYAALGGVVHSYAFNEGFGDYGATLILQHQLETKLFYTLYGHLGLQDIAGLQEGKYIIRGATVGHLGLPAENGNWPPHLHFQIIGDMRLYKGDYPGVCTKTEADKYLDNCPDADLILQLMKYADQ